MSRVSINGLSEYTGFDRRTITRRLAEIPRGEDKRYDSAEALAALYAGGTPEDLNHSLARLYHERADLAELRRDRMRRD